MPDKELLVQLRQPATREAAFRVLVDRYGDRLYRHIRRMVSNADDAQDVLQNCLVKVFRGLDRFRSDSRLYTWLYRIATNEALSWLDKQKRRGELSLQDESFREDSLRADAYFNGDETERLLQAAISLLPDKQRAVFTLRYFEEMSYRDMSAALSTSEGALKASYHHAVRKVEDYLRKQMKQ